MEMTISSIGYLAVLGSVIFFTSCTPVPVDPAQSIPAKAEGWAPVYSKGVSAKEIRAIDPIPIEKGGKIYVKGNILYQVENGKGIHVVDISKPENPTKLKFISVPGAQELAIKNNVLYTNNLNDLVVLDISELSEVKQLKRLKDVFHLVNPAYPPGGGYFECVDISKGDVIGWEAKTLDSPKCIK